MFRVIERPLCRGSCVVWLMRLTLLSIKQRPLIWGESLVSLLLLSLFSVHERPLSSCGQYAKRMGKVSIMVVEIVVAESYRIRKTGSEGGDGVPSGDGMASAHG